MTTPLDIQRVEVSKNYHEPQRFESKEHVDNLLRECVLHKPSDIYISTGQPVVVKINGLLRRVTSRLIDWTEFRAIVSAMRQKENATDILNNRDLDGSYSVVCERTEFFERRTRFRNNYTKTYSNRGSESGQIVMRVISDTPPTPQDLGLSDEILAALTPRDGAVYIVGPTGSGKTTTFASIMRWICEGHSPYSGIGLTYEDPVEFDLMQLSSDRFMIFQHEISPENPIKNFQDGVRNAMRRAPDLAMIGEMRDIETIRTALEFAFTGHPIFSTLHANNVADTIPRLLKRFPSDEKGAALSDFLSTTRAILFQKLVPRVGGGRVALREWIPLTDDVREWIQQDANDRNIIIKMREALRQFGHPLIEDAERHLNQQLITQSVYDNIARSMKRELSEKG